MPQRMAAKWAVMSDPRGRKIVAWLRRLPIPAHVTAVDGDGEEIRVAVSDGKVKVRWTDIVDALEGATVIKAHDEHGGVLRQLRFDVSIEPALAQQEELQRQKLESRENAVPGREPILSIDVPRLVESIASNMQRASAAAAQQQSEAFSAGFKAMTDVVGLCVNMLTRVERRLDEEREAREEAEDDARALLTEGREQPDGEADRTQLALAAAMQTLGINPAKPGNGSSEVDFSQLAKLGELIKQYAPNSEG